MHLLSLTQKAHQMRLTTFSDYSLRVLMYLGVYPERLATTGEMAQACGISENHLKKVVYDLAPRGYIETTRGKGGGMRLARSLEKIDIGEVVRESEENVKLVECFDAAASDWRIEPAYVIKGILSGEVDAFFAVLEPYTLADLLVTKPKLAKMLVKGARRPCARHLE